VIVGENPVHDLLILHIVAAADDSLRFRLLNMAGSTVLRINSAVTTGDNFFYYPDAGAFPAGMYLLQINGEGLPSNHFPLEMVF